MDGRAIQQVLPHRPPFVWVDRIIECEPGKRARGIKLVSVNDPLVAPELTRTGKDAGDGASGDATGSFPRVLLVEAIAQVAAVALLPLVMDGGATESTGAAGTTAGTTDGMTGRSSPVLPLFAGMEEVTFARPVRAGDVVDIEVEVVQARRSAARVSGRCLVAGEVAAQGTFLFAFRRNG